MKNNLHKILEIKLRSEIIESKKKIDIYKNQNILSLTQKGIIIKNISNNEGQMPENYNGYQIVEKGNFCMNPMDLKTGWVDVSNFDGIISPSYFTFKNIGKKINNDYLKFLLQSRYINYDFFNKAKGIATHDGAGRWNIKFDDLLNTKFSIPILDEQQKIVCEINKKLSKINSILELVNLKLNKLNDFRKSFINHVISNGLPNNVTENKKSWSEYKVASIFTIKSVKGYSNETPLSVFREYGVVRRSDYENKNALPEDLSGYKLVDIGDLVINKMKTWSGSLGISNYRGIVSPAYYVLKILKKCDLFFLNYLLRSSLFVEKYDRISRGVRPGQWDLDIDEFNKIKLHLPTLKDQKLISEYIKQKLIELNKIFNLEKKRLKFLVKMRRSIIFNHVNNIKIHAQ